MQYGNICDDQRWPWLYLDHITLIEYYIYIVLQELKCSVRLQWKRKKQQQLT